jgi:hypothetical protein
LLSPIMAIQGGGDAVTLMYAPPPNGILDDQGRLFPEVQKLTCPNLVCPNEPAGISHSDVSDSHRAEVV